MTMMTRLVAGAALFASTAALAQAAAPAPAAAPIAAPAAPVAMVDADPALWVVKDGDTTIYLFGTVHVLKPGLSWFDEAVADAFTASDELVLELAPAENANVGPILQRLGRAEDGVALSSRLTDEQRDTYTRALATVNIPPAAFEPTDPWVPGMLLTVLPLQALGYDPASGAEATLTKAAEVAGKPVSGLETAELQLGLLDTLPIPAQVSFMVGAAEQALKGGDQLAQLIDLWKDGKPDELGALMNYELAESPELEESLLTNRNRTWAEWIATKIAAPGGSYFVAVGAGHLAGEHSVQSFLATRGLTVTRVAY